MTAILSVLGGPLAGWLVTPLVRWLLTAVGIAGIVWGFAAQQRHVGATKALVRVEAEALKTDEKAQPARRAAERKPDSVLKRYYRD